MGVLSYRSVVESTESDRWVQHTRDVLDGLQKLSLGMERISSSIRRFVITGEDRDLELYRTARSDIERLEPVVRGLMQDNPAQLRRFPVIEKLFNDRVERAEAIIGLRKNEGIEAAMTSVRDGPTARVSAEYKTVVQEMQGEEERLLALRREVVAANEWHTKLMLVAGIVLGLLITGCVRLERLAGQLRRGLAEAALKESERKYRTLVEGVKDYAILMLGPAWRDSQLESRRRTDAGWTFRRDRRPEFLPLLSAGRHRARQAAGDAPACRRQRRA